MLQTRNLLSSLVASLFTIIITFLVSVRPFFFIFLFGCGSFSCELFRGWKTLGCTLGDKLILLYLENGGRIGRVFFICG
jgi:hypothetical protein